MKSQQTLNSEHDNPMLGSDILNTFTIECHKHPKNQIVQGCLEEGCSNSVQCSQCIKEDQMHQVSHRKSIMSFADYLYSLAKLVKKASGDQKSPDAQKVHGLMKNENTAARYFESKMKTEKENFVKHADLLATVLVHKLMKLKQDVEDFYEKQIWTFRNNMVYFKQQYKAVNPEDSYLKYTDLLDIKQQLLTKTPYQAFYFLQNLRKASGVEGKIMNHLVYTCDKITHQHQNPPHFAKGLFDSNIESLKETVNEIEQKIRENLMGIPEIHQDYISKQTQNLLSFNRKSLQINSQHLLDKVNFDFSVTGTIQTYHLNSVTALVALTDDVVATASYDRTIKIWRLSDGFLLKQLQDRNSVTCLSLMKFSNTKSNNPHSYSETDSKMLAQQIHDNPEKTLSALGFLLISSGFDRVVKVWDFNFLESYARPKAMLEEYEGDNIFVENFNKVNEKYIKKHTQGMSEIKKLKFELEMEKHKNKGPLQMSKSLVFPNIMNEYNLPNADSIYSSIQPIKELRGHTRWVTAICNLEDEHNIITGDEGGEFIIWNVVPLGKQLFRIQFGQETLINQIVVINPFRTIGVASGEMVKIWNLGYVEDNTQFVPRLNNCVLDKNFNLKDHVYILSVPQTFKNIVIAGCKAGLIKYIDIQKGRVVSVQTDHDEFVGDIIVLEKIKSLENEEDFFHKNINLIIVGSRKLGLYNGYGQIISSVQPASAEDFSSSAILPGRNLQVVKFGKRQDITEIKVAVVSQFSSDYYNYKSSRISLLSLISQTVDFI